MTYKQIVKQSLAENLEAIKQVHRTLDSIYLDLDNVPVVKKTITTHALDDAIASIVSAENNISLLIRDLEGM